MLADLAEIERPGGEMRNILVRAGPDDIKKGLGQELGRQTRDGDVGVLGESELVDFSQVELYLFFKSVDRVFAWPFETAQPRL